MAIFGPGNPIDGRCLCAGYIWTTTTRTLLWYIGGAICALSVLAFYALHLRPRRQADFVPAKEEGLPFPAITD
jgi:hypothetical protein